MRKSLFLTRLIDASADGILAFDHECRCMEWNQEMERISGIAREDALGKNAFNLFPFFQQTTERQCLQAALTGQSAVSDNKSYSVPESGREGFLRAYYSPLRDAGNQIVGGIAIIRDITEHKRAEEESQETHQRLAFHVENSPLAVVEWDSDFRLSRWSESAERLFGWKADEVIGKHFSEWHLVFDEDIEAVAKVTDRQRGGAEQRGVLRNRNYTKDGSVLYCEWYNSVLHDDSGQLVSVLSLVLDVTARKVAEEERAALLARERNLRKHAEEADRLKDEFLATLSHELRTPLTSILGWASLVRNREIDEDQVDQAIETIERNARSQARLIDDLLDVSRIITGNLRLDLHPLDLATIVEAAIDALLPTADAKQIQLQTNFDSDRCLVKGDPHRLRQVIWNLLLNAIKFTPRGGTVIVRLKEEGASVQLTVSDNGEGIVAEFLPYVFDRFRQAEGSMSRRQGGLGLGLAVVRHLVELHGGNVSAESPGKGLGSTFTVALPLVEERRTIAGSGGGQKEIERRSSGKEMRLDGVRVLLVEDDDDSRWLVGTILRRQGAEVIATSSTSEALSAFERSAPDVMVSDLGMPEQDGFELMRKVRLLSEERGGLAPAIALTGYASPKDRERSLEAGYQLHLSKPVESAELISAVASLVGRRD